MDVLSFSEAEITSDDGRRYTQYSYIDTSGQTRHLIFKAREELPIFNADIHSRAKHLGSAPRLIPDAQQRFEHWKPTLANGLEPSYYFVDATPLGAILLALEISYDPKLQKIADDMQRGIYSDEALAIVDAYTAIMYIHPEKYESFNKIKDDWYQKNIELNEKMFHIYKYLITGIVPNELDADTTEHIRSLTEISHRNTDISDRQDQLLELLEELHNQGHVDEFLRIASATQTLNKSPLMTHELKQLVTTATTRFRDARDDLDMYASSSVFGEEKGPDAVLTLVLALSGDKDAGKQVAHCIEIMMESDELAAALDTQLVRRRLFHTKANDGVRPEELVLVHATKYEPEISEDGTVKIHPRIDTQGFPRASVHFTLNHRVVGHLYGDWSDTGLTIVAPLSLAVEENGIPRNLRGIDTWWQCNPGVGVTLPGAVIIKDSPDLGTLRERSDNIIYIKSSNFSREDALRFLEYSIENNDLNEYINCFNNSEADEKHKKFVALLESATDYSSGTPRLNKQKLDQIQEMLTTIDLSSDSVQHGFGSINRGIAINEIIRSMGGEIYHGGMWACSHEGAIEDLAVELGTCSSPHSHTVDSRIEGTSTGWMHDEHVHSSISYQERAPIEARRAINISGVSTMSREPVRQISSSRDRLPG